MMGVNEVEEVVARSTTASRVPLRVEDQQAIRVIAEALRPHGRPAKPSRREAA